jgi:hypothetical protein
LSCASFSSAAFDVTSASLSEPEGEAFFCAENGLHKFLSAAEHYTKGIVSVKGGDQMNKTGKAILAAIFFLAWLAVIPVAWSAPDEGDRESILAIRTLIVRKEQAVNGRNFGRFLDVINRDLPFYVEEQKRWFQDAIRYVDPGTFRLQVLDMAKMDSGTFRVLVRQSWSHQAKRRQVVYPLLIKKTSAGWKDSDLAFAEIGTPVLKVRYTHPAQKQQAELAFSVLSKAVRALHVRYGWTPKRIEVKLYHQPEVFRQSVKLSLPEWAGGWHEANQSIKLVGGLRDSGWFAPALVHELTHQMVSELTHDNAAYWLQEGAAMYYEAHLLPELRAGHSVQVLEKTGPMLLEELKRTRLERLGDADALRYYLSAYVWFRAETEKRGESAWASVFSRLRGYPFLDLDGDEKREITNRLTDEAMKAVWSNHVRTKSP